MAINKGHRLILCLHSVAPSLPQQADWRAYWMPMAEFAPLFERMEEQASKGDFEVEITCDDGYLSHYTELFPWLLDRGLKATFFVPTDNLGQPKHIDITQMRELHAAGMTFGSHGVKHLDWTKATPDQLETEIVTSKSVLEDILGTSVTKVAPPFGSYNRKVLSEIKKSGYETIYTCDGGFGSAQGLLRSRVSLQRGEPAQKILSLGARGGRRLDRVRQIYHNARMLQLS